MTNVQTVALIINVLLVGVAGGLVAGFRVKGSSTKCPNCGYSTLSWAHYRGNGLTLIISGLAIMLAAALLQERAYAITGLLLGATATLVGHRQWETSGGKCAHCKVTLSPSEMQRVVAATRARTH